MNNYLPTKINLSKVQKCGQYWDDMTPNEQGRLCSQCNKTIIDFRKMNDKEVAMEHLFSDEAVCGIYKPSQLGAPSLRLKNKNKTAGFIGLSLLSFIAPSEMEANTREQTELTQSNNHRTTFKKQHQDRQVPTKVEQDSLIIKGKVLDPISLNPLAGVTVHLLGTSAGTISDYNGNYYFDLTEVIDAELDSIVIAYTYTGYARDVFDCSDQITDFKTGKSLVIEYNPQLETSLIVASFGVTRRPWYQRFWRWMTGPFR